MADYTIVHHGLKEAGSLSSKSRDVHRSKQSKLPFSSLKRDRSEAIDEAGIRKRRRTTPSLTDSLSTGVATARDEKWPSSIAPADDLTLYLKKIALSHKTAFQKKVLTLLCQVPSGQYTTYGAISAHLSSSPRAVGNALRNNPFAPQVPCHRVLASGGGLGGFGGSWGRKGEAGVNDDKKRKLLRDEGVRFDGKGKVVGRVWDDFK